MMLLRAAVLGVATGCRSSVGLAALAVTAGRSRAVRRSSGASWVDNPWTSRVALLGCAGELVGDKLPKTPSRLEPAGQISRLALGGVCGAILARREGHSPMQTAAAAAIGATAAVAGTRLGASWRRRSSAKLGRDLPGAVIEDAIAIGTATLAVGGVCAD